MIDGRYYLHVSRLILVSKRFLQKFAIMYKIQKLFLIHKIYLYIYSLMSLCFIGDIIEQMSYKIIVIC